VIPSSAGVIRKVSPSVIDDTVYVVTAGAGWEGCEGAEGESDPQAAQVTTAASASPPYFLSTVSLRSA